MLDLIHKRWKKQEKQEETIARMTTNAREQKNLIKLQKKKI